MSAIGLAREWGNKCKTEPPVSAGKVSQELPTPAGAMVVRSDATWCSTTNVVGLGWSISSPTQNQNFQRRLEFVDSPLMAEGLALREGVTTCRRLEARVVRFESDSAQLMKCINSSSGVAELHTVVSDILAVASEFESVVFVWIPRERNKVADSFAKNALAVTEPLVVEDVVNSPH